MKPFEFYSPTRIIFGPGRLKEAGKWAASLGGKTLVLIGGGSVRKNGALKTLERELSQSGVDYVVFEGIEPNPRHTTVNKAGKIAHDEKVDFVLALGGGSVMDAAKFVAVLAKDPNIDSWELTLGGAHHNEAGDPIPVLAIPTTAATASEVTPFAVLSNAEINGKAPMAHEKVKPAIAILDPELTVSLPPETTADGAADILSHLFENYLLGGNFSPVADVYTEGIMRTVLEETPKVFHDGTDLDARANLQWCATLALNGMQLAGRVPSAFALHAMEHSLSGVKPDLSHGRGLAILYPSYFTWMLENGRGIDRMARLAREVFLADEDDDARAARLFIRKLGDWLNLHDLYDNLQSVGISETDYEKVAEYCVQTYGDGRAVGRVLGELTKADILEILIGTERQEPKAKENQVFSLPGEAGKLLAT